jgi:hypothetical protein
MAETCAAIYIRVPIMAWYVASGAVLDSTETRLKD